MTTKRRNNLLLTIVACCALLIVSSIPEWLDLISHRTERIRFMKKEEQRLAKSTKPE